MYNKRRRHITDTSKRLDLEELKCKKSKLKKNKRKVLEIFDGQELQEILNCLYDVANIIEDLR